jgi:hypothetical protein
MPTLYSSFLKPVSCQAVTPRRSAIACGLGITLAVSTHAGVHGLEAPRPERPIALRSVSVAANESEPLVLSTPVQAPIRRGDKRTPTLRCWQQGRLIYEGTGMAALPRTPSSIDLRGTSSNDTVLQVLDLRAGLCLIEVR